ncbi:hypothetical protein ECC02_009415 [Trypanosoma cruzi]|uniref:Uncharacterized protein n=1 Tax=Trypanosoma cruzi TaxID=5693 RepID=A0A7J6XTC4_TRYCR|nr:hypothetical protein ECC02_009415 [Trypanosoma cruzi]
MRRTHTHISSMEKEEWRLHEGCCHEHGGRVHEGRTSNNKAPDSTHTTPWHLKPTRSCSQWTGKRAQQCGRNTKMPVQKRIPKRREKETKKKLSPTVATSNNASNNNGNKHHTRQLTEAVSSLSPTFMAARHRTPRVSIAPPPSSFQRHSIGSIRTRRHATLNDPTGNRPTTVAEITHPRQSTRRKTISRGPRRQKNVMSTVWPAHGTIDRRNREVRQALNQGLSTHIHTMLF